MKWEQRATAALGALILLGAIRRDEVHCEEASVRVEECCDGIDVERMDCYHDDPGCGVPPDPTLLTVNDAKCIRDLDCEAMVDGGVCAEIAAAVAEGEPLEDRPALALEPCR